MYINNNTLSRITPLVQNYVYNLFVTIFKLDLQMYIFVLVYLINYIIKKLSNIELFFKLT